MTQQTPKVKKQEGYDEDNDTRRRKGYSPRQRAGFTRRVKNVAKKISAHSENVMVIMMLTNLETRLDIELEWL